MYILQFWSGKVCRQDNTFELYEDLENFVKMKFESIITKLQKKLIHEGKTISFPYRCDGSPICYEIKIKLF